ncbi:MAG TPA: hypothetical protein VFB27_11305 [Opitutaceae bacterium]|nr:hypothetical protein [Opitutaceae bacterium]
MPRFFPFFAAAAALVAIVPARAADAAAIIAKARAYLGPEAALDSIRSIHYVGSFESDETVKDKDGKLSTRHFKAALDLIFQKPYQQRVVMTSDRGRDITALDNYEAWECLQQPGDTSVRNLNLFGKDQVKDRRANVWENLSFYRGIERRGGHVEDLGPTTVDGHACEKLAFVHGPNIVFYRYIDTATGQLRLTELTNGDRIRQEGELTAGGVRFPRKLINLTKDPASGKEYTAVITLDKVVLNETFPDSLFAVPLLAAPALSAPSPKAK